MAIDIRRTDSTSQTAPTAKTGKPEPTKVKPKELHVGDKIEGKAAAQTTQVATTAPIVLTDEARADALRLFETLDAQVGTKRPDGKIAEFLELTPPPLQQLMTVQADPKEAAQAIAHAIEGEPNAHHGEALREALIGGDREEVVAAMHALPAPTRAVFEKLPPMTMESIARALKQPLGKKTEAQANANALPKEAEDELHSLFSTHSSALDGMDVEMLAQIVMMECSKDAETDLRAMLLDMKSVTEKKRQMRAQISEAKAAKAAMEGEIRAEYDARTKLSIDNTLFIDKDKVTFADYLAVRAVMGNVPALDLTNDLPLYPLDPTLTINPAFLSQNAGSNDSAYATTTSESGAGVAGAHAPGREVDEREEKKPKAPPPPPHSGPANAPTPPNPPTGEQPTGVLLDIAPPLFILTDAVIVTPLHALPQVQNFTGDRSLDEMLDKMLASSPLDVSKLVAEITKRYPRAADQQGFAEWMCQRMGAHKPPVSSDKVAGALTALHTQLDAGLARRKLAADNGNDKFYAHKEGGGTAMSVGVDAQIQSLQDAKDGLGDLGEEMQLKLQQYMERRSKVTQALSNLMKKISDTASNTIQNLKG